MNLHWPYTPGSKWVPWYTMIRRALCMPGFCLFRFLTWLFVLLGWGWQDAKFWWEESW